MPGTITKGGVIGIVLICCDVIFVGVFTCCGVKRTRPTTIPRRNGLIISIKDTAFAAQGFGGLQMFFSKGDGGGCTIGDISELPDRLKRFLSSNDGIGVGYHRVVGNSTDIGVW